MNASTLLWSVGALLVAASAVAAPLNDNMANAQLVGEGTYSFNSADATLDGPTYSCESGPVQLGKDIWYKIHTLEAGTVKVSTCNSSFDTSIAVYLGLTTATRIGCNDQRPQGTCAGGSQSYFQFEATADTSYLINVGGFNNQGGAGFLQVTGPLAALTTFTYQGRLVNGGSAFTGLANVSFKLFDANAGGAQVGATQARDSVPVVGGVFSVNLAFDAPMPLTTPLWIEPTVNGSALTRQRLTSSPVAVHALSAQQVTWTGITGVPASVSGAFSPWVKSGSNIFYSLGSVGVGTAPEFPLHVASNTLLTTQLESSSAFGTWFNIRNTSVGGLYWHQISTGASNGEGAGKLLIGWGSLAGNTNTVMTLQPNGNVGIGTTSASQRLTVNGNVLANNVGVPSSIRFKDHVVPLEGALESLLKLEGVRFDWKPEFAKERGFVSDVGFVAEDVAKVFPEIVLKDGEGNVIGMDYSRVTAVAVEAIKQLKVQHEKEMGEMRERIEKLEKAMEKAK